MIIIPIKWLFHWEYTLFSDKPIWGDHQLIQIHCNSPSPSSLVFEAFQVLDLLAPKIFGSSTLSVPMLGSSILTHT
jgi:hypothetical protein